MRDAPTDGPAFPDDSATKAKGPAKAKSKELAKAHDPARPSFGNKPIVFGIELAKPLAPKQYLVPHFGFGPGRVCMVSARGGVGKTIALQSLELAVAGDLPTVWGVRVGKHGRVLHLDYEMGEDLFRRYQRLAGPLGVDLAGLGDRLGVATFPEAYMTTEGGFYEPLGKLCIGVTLLVLDSFAAAGMGFSAGENDSSSRLFLDQLSRISESTGCTIIVIHHDGKGGKTRGSSGIEDALGSLVNVTADKDGTLVLTHEKASSSAKAEPLFLKIVDVGEHDPLTGTTPGLAVEALGAKPTAAYSGGGDPAEWNAMLAIREALGAGPKNRTQLLDEIPARSEVKVKALRTLVQDRAVLVSNGPNRTKLYSLAEDQEALT